MKRRTPVLLLALTVADPDPMAARGAIREFWNAYRNAFGKRPYFSWAELQRRGAVHYHAILVNPPWRMRRTAAAWIGRHWKLAEIQPSIQFREFAWFSEQGGRYVRKYASAKWNSSRSGAAELAGSTDGGRIEVEDKSYQQDYDLLPREIRTWESNRLEHLVAEVDAHQTQTDIVWLRPMAPFPERIQHVWLLGYWRHFTPRISACTLGQKKPPPRISNNETAAFGEDRSGTDTASSLSD